MLKKTLSATGIALAAVMLISAPPAFAKKTADKKVGKNETYIIDSAASKITWEGTKVGGAHTGTVQVKSGKLKVKNHKLASAQVVVDLKTIQNTDLEDADYKKKLEDHLKSKDFFHVDKHPVARFNLTSFSEVHNLVPGEPNAEVKGKMTIRGITKPFQTKVFFEPKDEGFTIKGKIKIDRTQFKLKYNSGKFFDVKALGDKLIHDEFTVDLDLVAMKKK